MALNQIAATLALVGLPFVLSAATALVVGILRRDRSQVTERTAGDWLSEQVLCIDGLRCGVSPELAMEADGYWPHADTITLGPETWRGIDVDARAIAAHELGHALEHRARPVLARRLELGRRAHGLATQAFAAVAVISALYGSSLLTPLLWVTLVATVVLGLATVVEEGLASRQATRWLAHRELDDAVRRRAGRAMWGAFATYAAEWVGRVVLLGVWSVAGTWLVSGDPLAFTVDVAWLGWAVFLLLPVLALHAGATLLGAVRPPVADSEFRLAWTAQRDASWEFHAALVLLVWATLAAMHPWGRLYAPLVVLALVPAMGPLSHLARGMALVPVIAVWAVGAQLGLWGGETRPVRGRAPRPLAATQLAVLDEDALTRLGRLVRIAYAPLAVVWGVAFLGG